MSTSNELMFHVMEIMGRAEEDGMFKVAINARRKEIA